MRWTHFFLCVSCLATLAPSFSLCFVFGHIDSSFFCVFRVWRHRKITRYCYCSRPRLSLRVQTVYTLTLCCVACIETSERFALASLPHSLISDHFVINRAVDEELHHKIAILSNIHWSKGPELLSKVFQSIQWTKQEFIKLLENLFSVALCREPGKVCWCVLFVVY